MDPLDEIPEFDKPENIPLVVPDVPSPAPSLKRHCKEKNKEGNPCGFHPLKNLDYCLGHAKKLKLWTHKPSIIPGLKAPRGATAKFKTREEILAMLSKRLDLVEERFGAICNPEVEEMICDICRTIAVMMKVEASEDLAIRGWRMKGTA